MDRKILFFDIDGTIFDPKIGVTAKTKEALNLLKQNGHLIFIATGRAKAMVKSEFLNLGFNGLNAACGTYITYNNELMLNRVLPDYIVAETIEILEKCNITDIIFEGEKSLFIDKSLNSKVFSKFDSFFEVRDFKSEKVIANKLSVRLNNIDELKKAEPVINKYFDIIGRGNNLVELVPISHSKATGIKYIIEHLGIDLENTYAFGDSENDIDMLKYVNHSVAMGNSSSYIKSIAKYQTDTIFNDGVYNGLKRLKLI